MTLPAHFRVHFGDWYADIVLYVSPARKSQIDIALHVGCGKCENFVLAWYLKMCG